MKATEKKRSIDISSEEAMKQIQKIFKERGTKALEIARKEVLQEKIECKEAREALVYFMTEYWNDLARPTLLSLTCEAVSGDPELTTPMAVSTILISGAIDIHDDIIDQSKTKNGRPTVYGKFGQDIALLVGDMLLGKGLILMNEAVKKNISREKMAGISDIVRTMFLELGDAEALELQLRGRMDVTPEEYLYVVRKKAADVEAHTRIGAILGGGTFEEIDALGEYGRLLGMLIILRDDWIDVLDLEELRNRIKRECLPLPILYALEEPKVRREVDSISFSEVTTSKKAKILRERIHDTKAVGQYKELMGEIAKQAYSLLEKNATRRDCLRLFVKAVLSLNAGEEES